MKELICINPKNYKLTVGKTYPIIIEEENTIVLLNDNNKTVRYYKELFKEVEEEVIPEPVAPVRTEQDLIDSIEINDDEDITYVDFTGEKVFIQNNLDILDNDNDFSCGVKNVVNIASQTAEILGAIEEDQDSLGDDLNGLQKALFKTCIKSFIKKRSENGYNGGIYLLSCNVTGEGYLSEEIVDILNDISDFNTNPELNPNSDNEIMIWGFYKSNL